MTEDTAELTYAPVELPVAAPVHPAAAAPARAAGLRLRLGAERAAALRAVWRALLLSRALVWTAGVSTVLLFGYGPVRRAFDPPGVTRGFGWLGNLLAAPAARWDAAWYLVIARYGYHPALGAYTSSRDAFFPLYPLAVRALAELGVPAVAGGVAVSVSALACALYGIHRLMTLERSSSDAAGVAVALCAFAPMAFFFSAVYSESLYLALSVGVFWSARNGRWAWVALLGALAGATRSAGLVLIVPALLIYLYGPRTDRRPDAPRAGSARESTSARRVAALLPRYRVQRDALWLCALPLGVVLYGVYLGLAGGDPLAPLHAQEVWGRHFAGPFVGVWDGLRAAFDGARQLLSFQRAHLYYPTGGESAFVSASHNLVQFAFLALAASDRRRAALPLAYGAYVLAALARPLSIPVSAQPLMSLPRSCSCCSRSSCGSACGSASTRA